MNIILIQPDELNHRTVVFSKHDQRFKHIEKVLKLSIGSIFKVGIINGEKGIAKITAFSADSLTAVFTADSPATELPRIRLILGFPRPIQLRRILRDVAGLGIEALYLTGTELGEKSYLQADIAAKTEVERLLIDGCCQAGETKIPLVYRSVSLWNFFEHYGAEIAPCHLRAVLDVPSTEPVEGNSLVPLTSLQWNGSSPLWLAIGNERGWSLNERILFTEQQFKSYSMGKRILRTETATAAALAVCLALGGIWSD